MKVAENLHTTSSRYSGWFPCFKSRGIGPPLYRNQKVTKYKGYADLFLHYGNFSAISMKIGRLYARKICAKCVKTRKKFVRSAFTLPWSCLRQKNTPERAVHMCGHGPKASSLNTYARGGGLRMPKNADLLDSFWLGSQSRGPDALWLDIRSTTAAWRSHEFGKTKKNAHGSSVGRLVWTGSAHVDRSLRPSAAPYL